MGIRAFQESDIEAAGQMAHDIWAYELEGTRPELNRFIHEYLVRYYDVNRHSSFSVVDDGLDAFLLAGLKADRSGCDDWFCRKLSFFPDKEKRLHRNTGIISPETVMPSKSSWRKTMSRWDFS